MFFGNLEYDVLRQLYDASTTFVHLAYLDHCPNVVVDAHAHECHIVCSSTGGTKEVVTKGTLILENPWDFSPIELYKPPELNLEDIIEYNASCANKLAEACLSKYKKVFKEIK